MCGQVAGVMSTLATQFNQPEFLPSTTRARAKVEVGSLPSSVLASGQGSGLFRRNVLLYAPVQGISVPTVMDFTMAIWTQRSHVARIVWTLVRQTPDMMRFKIRCPIYGGKWGRRTAALALACSSA